MTAGAVPQGRFTKTGRGNRIPQNGREKIFAISLFRGWDKFRWGGGRGGKRVNREGGRKVKSEVRKNARKRP